MIITKKGETEINGSFSEIEADITCIIDSFINMCKTELGMDDKFIDQEINDIISVAKKSDEECIEDINKYCCQILEKILKKNLGEDI